MRTRAERKLRREIILLRAQRNRAKGIAVKWALRAGMLYGAARPVKDALSVSPYGMPFVDLSKLTVDDIQTFHEAFGNDPG